MGAGKADDFAQVVNEQQAQHAEEEADENGLSALDVESVVLAGAIIERQKDRETQEWKYVVSGETLDGRDAFVVAKFGLLGSLYFLIVYEQ